MIRAVYPARDLGQSLQTIEKPARYLGGESGSIAKPDAALRFMLCFPDLYEIGMSNNAMRILYAGLNALDDVSCERVFAPAQDYAALLKERSLPLYGLETGTPVANADILGFTVGYELAATTMLLVLDSSGIPLTVDERGDKHPIVIAGGPAMTNPVPYASILDGVWIGEAEDAFYRLCEDLAAMKRKGAGRAELKGRMAEEQALWMPGKNAVREIYSGFSRTFYGHRFPVPVLKPVQDHGVVEIMRGCPNGCRFCHAGYFYRPQRLRDPELISREVEAQVKLAGHREITLTSLSSGDYPHIFRLLSILNKRWSREGVSFQLPSLKVESFSLDLIDQVSGTRKSGLTFAVETPLEQWQMTVNKKVAMPKLLSILKEAEAHGYRVAKFYFMIGLPLPAAGISEEEAIAAFIQDISASTPLKINVTLSTYIPKPHTPFQWSAQLTPQEAARRIYAIKDALKKNNRVKISYHGPYVSMLEGIVSRGDGRVGALLLEAYRRGASFDAWDDKINKDAWDGALAASGLDRDELLGARDMEAPLPWDGIKLRVSKAYLRREAEKAFASELSPICMEKCTTPCGACSDTVSVQGDDERERIARALDFLEADLGRAGDASSQTEQRPSDGEYRRSRILFSYSKTGNAAYYPHHTLWNLIASAFERSGRFLEYSQGFNPAPRLEISEPLSLGTASREEYGTALLRDSSIDIFGTEDREAVQSFLPEGLSIDFAAVIQGYEGKRIPSLSMLHWGSEFSLAFSAELSLDFEACCLALGHEVARHPALYGASVSHDQATRSCTVLLPFGGKRELGLQSLFKAACGVDLRDTGILVTRLRQFAKSPQGGAISYREFFNV